MEDIWKDALAEIEVEVSKPIFLTFFKPTTLVSLTDSIASIDAPTHITAEYIEKRYYSLIKRVLDKKTGQNISLTFTSNGARGSTKKAVDGPLFSKELPTSFKKNLPARIRPDYTFESLAVSDSNQLAYTAALTVASNPGTRYNPLFLYGSVGVGKTHLMNAVAIKAFTDNPDAKILYLTTEEFTNEVVEAIRDKNTTNLRKKFRNVTLLLLDDIQFLAGKEKVQEELFHTFNTLIDKGGQVVFSSDRPPSEIRKIEARLASRFEGGLTVDIEPPDFELRTAILLIKSRKFGMVFDYDAAKSVAERVQDTRALEGFLLRLASTRLDNPKEEVTLSDVMPLLSKTKQPTNILHPDNVIQSICNFYNIKPTQLKGVKRDAFLIGPRHTCMFLLKEEANLTYVEIGNLLGGRDHTTVMHAVEKIRGLVSNSEKTKEEILFIKRKIKEDLL